MAIMDRIGPMDIMGLIGIIPSARRYEETTKRPLRLFIGHLVGGYQDVPKTLGLL
jgi:hypothetical protein